MIKFPILLFFFKMLFPILKKKWKLTKKVFNLLCEENFDFKMNQILNELITLLKDIIKKVPIIIIRIYNGFFSL
jgi:hypothetical protein